MNARNKLLVVVTALILAGALLAIGVAAPAAASGDGHADPTADESEHGTDEEPTDNQHDADESTASVDEDDPPEEAGGDETPDAEDTPEASVTFEAQETEGETVVVDEVTMDDGGFVTIHNSSLLVGDTFDSVIGVSEYLEAGTHEDVEVTLDDTLEESETLIAMPHLDTNDNETYDFVETEGAEDGPYLTPEGEAVTDDATVTVSDETEEEDESEETPEDDGPPDETPGEAPNETPGDGGPPDETPGDAPNETPDEEPNETPDEAPNETPDDAPNETPDDTEDTPEASVTFEAQETEGDTVVVDEVTMEDGGFVTIHDSSLLDGDGIGSVVGVSEYLEAGTHEDVEVTLDDTLEESETLIAMPHLDTDDNEAYDFVETEGAEDGPYLTPEGEAVTDDATVTVSDETGEDDAEAPGDGGPPDETPGDGGPPNETPGEAPNETPGEAPNETPDEAPNETPGDAPNETPDEAPNGTPDEAPNETPDDAPNETPSEAAPGAPADRMPVHDREFNVTIEEATIFATTNQLDEIPMNESQIAEAALDDGDENASEEAPATEDEATESPDDDETTDNETADDVQTHSLESATVVVMVQNVSVEDPAGDEGTEQDDENASADDQADNATGDDGVTEVTVEHATILVVVDDGDAPQETPGEEPAETTGEENATDDETADAEDDVGVGAAGGQHNVTIQNATIYVVGDAMQDDSLGNESADENATDENATDENATDDATDDEQPPEDGETDAVDTADHGLQITIERATIHVIGGADADGADNATADEPAAEDDALDDNATADGVDAQDPTSDERNVTTYEEQDLEITIERPSVLVVGEPHGQMYGAEVADETEHDHTGDNETDHVGADVPARVGIV